MNISTLEQVRKDMEHGVYNHTNNGECTGCGDCCSNLLTMTEKEIEAIKRYIKKHHIKECKHTIPLANPVLDMTCPFLNTGKKTEKCKIYSVRPNICRKFSCDPEQRPELDIEYAVRARVVNVRETFYGKD